MLFTSRSLNALLMVYTAFTIGACASTGSKDVLETSQPPVELSSTPNRESVLFDASDRKTLAAADQTLSEQTAAGSNISILLNRAQLALLDNRPDDAEKQVRAALALDLKNTKARRILAQVFFKKGQTDSAEIALTSLGDQADKDAEALNLRALIALKRNKPSQAMAMFKKALTVSPGNAAVRMNLGVLYLTYRQINAAAVQFERILVDHPRHMDAKFHLAVTRSAMGNTEYSRKVYEQVLDNYEDHPLALFNIAIIEAADGQYDQAIKNLKSYLATEHAKASNNKDVFAMIEEFERDQSSLARGASDEEIQKMAAKSLEGEAGKKTASTADSADLYGENGTTLPPNAAKPTAQSNNAATQSATKPQSSQGSPEASPTQDKPKKPHSVDADIDMLQKELAQ